MRKLLMLALAMLWLNSYSQNSKPSDLLDKTSFEVIQLKNKESNSQLMEVNNETQGFVMQYITDIQSEKISEVYYFNKQNKCVCYRIIENSSDLMDEIDYLLNNGYKMVKANVYQHFIIDLVATIIVDKKLMSIDFTRKPNTKKK